MRVSARLATKARSSKVVAIWSGVSGTQRREHHSVKPQRADGISLQLATCYTFPSVSSVATKLEQAPVVCPHLTEQKHNIAGNVRHLHHPGGKMRVHAIKAFSIISPWAGGYLCHHGTHQRDHAGQRLLVCHARHRADRGAALPPSTLLAAASGSAQSR